MSDYVTYLRVLRVAFLFALLPLCLSGTTLDNIGGYINLSQVWTETDSDSGSTTTNLRQEYSGRWSESLSEYLKVEAGYRYFRFDQDQKTTAQPNSPYPNSETTISVWRQENLPSARISFDHPLVSITSFVQQRDAKGKLSINDLTQKNFEISMRTRSLNIPMLSTNFTRIHNYGQTGQAGKNILEQRLTISLNQSFDKISLRYNFSHSLNENKVTLLETTTNNHQLRTTYSDMGSGDKKFRYSASYQLDHSKRTDRLPNSQTLIHRIPVSSGLYLDQGDPLIGGLEVVPGLTDGNRSQPTNPSIDIGAGLTGRHLGVDLGTNRSIGALYIYCSQISDENLQWSVYVSDDNFSWQLHDANPDIVFNTIENRYEIIFDSVITQYLKAVNSGFNQVDNVIITEIEALQQVAADGEVTQSNTSHLTYLSGRYRFSDVMSLQSDISYQREPSVGLLGRRDNIYSTSKLNYRLSEVVTNSLTLQQNYQLSQGIVPDVTDYSLQYNLQYDPYETLRMSWSAVGRISNFDHERNGEDLNISWRGSGNPLPGMTVRLSTSYGRYKRLIIDQTSSSWNRQISFEGLLTRTITATLSYQFIQSKINETGIDLKRDRYNASLMWRLTSQINLQGTINWSRGGYRYDSKELFANWRMSNALSLSGSYYKSNNSDNSITERKSFNTNCRISNRTSLYFSYIDNQFSQLGRDQSSSLQLGLRSSF